MSTSSSTGIGVQSVDVDVASSCVKGGRCWCPPLVQKDIEQLDELATGLLVAGGSRVTVPGITAIGQEVIVYGLDVLHCTVPPAVVVASLPPGVVGVNIAAIAGQDVVEIKDSHIVVGIADQPVVDQPVIEGAGVGRVCRVGVVLHLRGCSNDDEQLVLAGGEVGQDVAVDALGVGDGMVLRPAVLTPQGVVAGSGRVVRVPL